MHLTRLAGLLPALALLGSCAVWPRYYNVPAEQCVDEAVDDFDLTGFDVPSVMHVRGRIETCGWATPSELVQQDLDAPFWPGSCDGSCDYGPSCEATGICSAGWFTEEVDLWTFQLTEEAQLSFELTWVNSPCEAGEASCENAPYQPDDPGGPWESQTDLDAVLMDVGFDPGQLRYIGGIGLRYPEASEGPIPVPADTPMAIAVGCHHGPPTDYDLIVSVRRRGASEAAVPPSCP